MHGHATTTRSRAARRRGKRFGAKTPTLAARLLVLTAASFAVAAPGDSRPPRPDLAAAKPLATCNLQPPPGAASAAPTMPRPVLQAETPVPVNDLQVNYVRSARGEWQIPPNVDREDPWNRLILLGPKQPLVIDVAVFVNGKSYRNVRETWIDDALSAGKSAEGGDTKAVPKAKEEPDAAAEGKMMPADEAKKMPAGDAEKPEAEKKSADAAGTEAASRASKEDAPPQAAEKKDADKKDAAAEPKAAGQAADEKQAEKQAAAEKKDEEKAAEPEMKVVDLQSRQAPAIRERLMTYLTTLGPSVSREEIRWFLAERGSGPPLVLLGPSLSWQRAGATPLLTYIDTDADGSLSKAEIDGLADQLKKADRDVDDVLELSEIRRATQRPPAIHYSTDHFMLVSIDELTNWNWLAGEIVRVYGQKPVADMPTAEPVASLKERIRRPDRALSGEALKALATEPADITLRVDFGAVEGRAAGVSLLAVSPEISRIKDAVVATPDVISVDFGADYLEISAAGGDENLAENFNTSQIAIGAAVDGDPFLRTIDRDRNNRLTSRERDALVSFVRGLDRDGDGQVSKAEIPVPLRLAVTLGPQVHQVLKDPTLAARITEAPLEVAKAPDWFIAADLNKDGDLSRAEFLGASDVFKRLDKDGDGRLSVAEALAAGDGE